MLNFFFYDASMILLEIHWFDFSRNHSFISPVEGMPLMFISPVSLFFPLPKSSFSSLNPFPNPL